MPLACKRNRFEKEGTTGRRRTPLRLVLVVFVLTVLIAPGVSPAARLAGEDQTVTTAPAPLPQKTSVAPPATVQPATPPASPAPASPGTAAGSAGSGVGSGRQLPPPPPPSRSLPPVPAAAPQVQSAQPLPAPPEVSPRAVAPQPGETAPLRPTVGPKPAVPVPQPQLQPQSPAPSPSGRYVTIDFDNVDITVFIKFVSELTGRNFVVDDKVKGKVTVISPKKIPVDEVYKVFESVLEIYGFATVQAGEVTKVILAQDARGKNLELRLKGEAIAAEDKIVTQILSLQHASPDEMKKVLDPLIAKTSIILSYPPTGMLIITDVLSNVKRLQEIVSALDVDGVGEVISYVPLKYAAAAEMARSLTTIFQQQAGKGALAPIKIVPDDRVNALIILATENDTKKVRELLALMDKEMPRGAGAIRVYYLQNAKAEELEKVLKGLPQQQARPAAGAAGGAAAAAASTAIFAKNVQIVADKSTNALIITADTADYLIIEDVIRKLDISRAMVYLEALIMEVNASKGFKLGVEWQGANEISRDGKQYGAVVGGISGDGGAFGVTSNLLAGKGLPSGLSLGVIGQAISVAVGSTTLTFPNLSAFINAYQNDKDVRILSTPQLLTLDNEEAEITVGSNIPYVTRQDTTTTSTTNYSSYEYKDVGVTLKVTPQINKDGFVRMKLDQTVTKVVSASATVSSGTAILTPTTLKRTAKTTVAIKDGETVVIGGMIEDNSDTGDYKVPLLGDIPLLGWLFKSRSRTSERNNLFVFITPRIIRTPEDAKGIHEDKKEFMEGIKEGTIKNAPVRKKETPEASKKVSEPTALKE
ncbi:MAG: type II secretion system secretin GspD [Deltaproteobacteria bacterium]|nr:type II secretion system secretin GspD [Deltaproteobacteria bacterium]